MAWGVLGSRPCVLAIACVLLWAGGVTQVAAEGRRYAQYEEVPVVANKVSRVSACGACARLIDMTCIVCGTHCVCMTCVCGFFVCVLQVGPYSNPTETYPYYSLPFCKPQELTHEAHELGELLSGDRKVRSPYDIRFTGASPNRSECCCCCCCCCGLFIWVCFSGGTRGVDLPFVIAAPGVRCVGLWMYASERRVANAVRNQPQSRRPEQVRSCM